MEQGEEPMETSARVVAEGCPKLSPCSCKRVLPVIGPLLGVNWCGWAVEWVGGWLSGWVVE